MDGLNQFAYMEKRSKKMSKAEQSLSILFLSLSLSLTSCLYRYIYLSIYFIHHHQNYSVLSVCPVDDIFAILSNKSVKKCL